MNFNDEVDAQMKRVDKMMDGVNKLIEDSKKRKTERKRKLVKGIPVAKAKGNKYINFGS